MAWIWPHCGCGLIQSLAWEFRRATNTALKRKKNDKRQVNREENVRNVIDVNIFSCTYMASPQIRKLKEVVRPF